MARDEGATDRIAIADTEVLSMDQVSMRPAHWAAVYSLSLGVFGLVTTEFLPASLLTPIASDLAVTPGTAGQAVTVTAVVAALAAPGVVLALPRMDRRLVVLVMTTLLLTSNITAALAGTFWLFLSARVALGVGLGAFWALSAALALRLVPTRDLPKAMAIIFTGVTAASVCAAPLGAFLGDLCGWRVTFGAVGVLALGILMLQLAVVPSMPAITPAGFATFASLLRRRSILVGLGTVLLVISGHTAGFTYLRVFLERVTSLGVGDISVVLLAFGVAGFAGNSLGAAIAGRNVGWSVGLSSVLLAISAALILVWGQSFVAVTIAATVWGVAFGAFPVAVQTWVTRSADDHAESGGALFVITWQTAIAAGAILGGVLVDRQGPVGAFDYAMLATLLGGLLMLAGGARTHPATLAAGGR